MAAILTVFSYTFGYTSVDHERALFRLAGQRKLADMAIQADGDGAAFQSA